MTLIRHIARSTLLVLLGLLAGPLRAETNDLLSTPEEKGQEIRGVLRALDRALLSSELNARVLEMPYREGESFRRGDLLIRFDCAAYQAQLAASQAAAAGRPAGAGPEPSIGRNEVCRPPCGGAL